MFHRRSGTAVRGFAMLCTVVALTVALPHTAGARPLTPSESYVHALYKFTGDQPTDDEVASWTSYLDDGGDRRTVSRTVVTRPDGLLGYLLASVYQTTVGREIEKGGQKYWMRRIKDDHMLLVPVVARIVGSPEAFDYIGNDLHAWVSLVYKMGMEREPKKAEVAYWSGQVATHGRIRVAAKVLRSLESRNQRAASFFQMALQRDPEPKAVAYWSPRLLEVGELEVLAELFSSEEFYDLATTVH